MEILHAPAPALREKGKKYLYKNEIRIWSGSRFNCEHGSQPSRCKVCSPEGYEKICEWKRERQCTPEYRAKANARNQNRTPENRAKQRARERERYATDSNYKLRKILRSRLTSALKGNAKCTSTLKLLGCNVEFLLKHLESQFTEGMTWQNQGEWHVDHIKPCAEFNLENEEEQRKCFHWTNLQPLWGPDNQGKALAGPKKRTAYGGGRLLF